MIDINAAFGEILSQNILTINFGQDISGMQVDLDMREFTTATDFYFKRRKVKIGEAITEMIEQVTFGSPFKNLNPFYQWAR